MTMKNYFLATLVFPCIYKGVGNANLFTYRSAAISMLNDAICCWQVNKDCTHFVYNPETFQKSWCAFPNFDVLLWKEKIVRGINCFSENKSSNKGIIAPMEFWKYNKITLQNQMLFLHLIQDKAYYSFIDLASTWMQDNIVFGGKVFEKNWQQELDDQIYVRLAKKYYESTKIKADSRWIEDVLKVSVFTTYSLELAEQTVKNIAVSDKVDEIIKKAKFDDEVWATPNCFVDMAINHIVQSMLGGIVL